MLEIKEVSFKDVLHDINLSFDKGTVSVIKGSNGCGKTVLFKIILGLLIADKGEIIYDGEKKTKKNIYFKNVGALIEDPDFNSWNTGIQNLRYLGSINKTYNEEYTAMLINKLGLTPDIDKVVLNYSLGMKKKLGIIQAVMENQELILLDEPTNGLDADSVAAFYEIIKDLKKEGKTILIASHIDSDIKEIADCVITIEAGNIVKKEMIKNDIK